MNHVVIPAQIKDDAKTCIFMISTQNLRKNRILMVLGRSFKFLNDEECIDAEDS